MGARSHSWSQMMDHEGTITSLSKKSTCSIDVESIPGVPGATRRVPRAPWHKEIMKIHFFNGEFYGDDLASKSFKNDKKKLICSLDFFELWPGGMHGALKSARTPVLERWACQTVVIVLVPFFKRTH